MKLFGIWVLTTQFGFRSRSCLYSTNNISKYVLAPLCGNTGTNFHRFDKLWHFICFSYHTDTFSEVNFSEAYWWRLVDDFVEINNNKEFIFTTPTQIFGDKYISH